MTLELVTRGLARDNRSHRRAIENIVEKQCTEMYGEFRDAHIAQLAHKRGIWAPGAGNPMVGGVFSAIDMSQSALQRSLETRAGKTFENISREVGELSYKVRNSVPVDALTDEQQRSVAQLMSMLDDKWPVGSEISGLANRDDTRNVLDYQRIFESLFLKDPARVVDGEFTSEDDTRHLVEVKASGKLNKSGSRAEKLKLVSTAVGYANHIRREGGQVPQITIHLCTALDGDLASVSPFVRQYWLKEELMLGRQFWGFITQLDDGAEVVWSTARRVAQDVGRRAMSEIISEAFPPTLGFVGDGDDEVDDEGLEL